MVRPVNHRLRLQQRPAAPSAIRPSRGITRQHTAVRGGIPRGHPRVGTVAYPWI